MVGCTLVTLKHHQRVVWIQTVAKQHHDFLRTACGGTIGRVLSAPASQLVLAYTQIVRPAHMCLRLRLAAGDDADDASAAAADTAFLACTTRGRLGAKQVRRAWQRHWEHFACGWARKQPPPTTLSFAAYRHVAIALQTSVLLPRAIASATMHASQIVRKKGESKGTEEGAERHGEQAELGAWPRRSKWFRMGATEAREKMYNGFSSSGHLLHARAHQQKKWLRVHRH